MALAYLQNDVNNLNDDEELFVLLCSEYFTFIILLLLFSLFCAGLTVENIAADEIMNFLLC